MKQNINFIVLILLQSIPFRLLAQEKEKETAQQKSQEEAAELAKKRANPIASLISVPFQNNTDYGISPYKGPKNTMNFLPDCAAGRGFKNLNLGSHKSRFRLEGTVSAYFPEIVFHLRKWQRILF